MFDKVLEKLKAVLVISSVLLILLALSEKLLLFIKINPKELQQIIMTYWYVSPIICIFMLVFIDEIRRKRFIVRLIKYPVFTFKIDLWIISISLSSLGYWGSAKLGLSVGTLVSPLTIVLWWSLLVYCAGIIVRHLIIHKKSDSDISKEELLYLDQPINQVQEDKLERSLFANRLSKIIETRDEKESIVIGLYGKWGTGKTSVLNLIKNDIHNEKNIITISFNPWFFENEGQLILQFFNRLITEIEKNFSGEKSELINKLKKYSGKLAPVALRMGPVNFSFKDFMDNFKNNDDIYSLRESIEQHLSKEGRRIVILIDDLDRLDDKEIYSVFKLVKLIADFPYTAYILAFDEEVVSDALSAQYSGNQPKYIGQSFLEKIIQVPLHLPPASSLDIRGILLEGIEGALNKNNITITKQETHRFLSNWERSFGKLPLNIRSVKRFLNSILFSVPLLKDEVNVVDLLCIEGLRVFFPEVHKFIFNHSNAFLTAGRSSGYESSNIADKYKPLINQLFNELTVKEKEVVITMVEELFPRSKYLLTGNNSYGADWEKSWANEQRICSEDYFHRYFVYAVTNGHISDVEFNSLLDKINQETIENIINRISSMANNRGFPKIIKKFRMIEHKIPAESAAKLVFCLSKLGERMPNNDGFLGIQTTMGQAAILIAQLIKLQPKEEQVTLAKCALENSKPISFSIEIFQRMRPYENEENNLFTEEEIKIIADEFINRIKKEVKKENFLLTNRGNVYALLWIWENWGDSQEVYTSILEWFNEENGAEKFLNIFVGEAYDATTGAPVIAAFEEDYYERVQQFIPATEVAEVLLKKYKMPNSEEDYYKAEGGPLYQQMAIQFLWFHKVRNSL